jgi:hypothetical protein
MVKHRCFHGPYAWANADFDGLAPSFKAWETRGSRIRRNPFCRRTLGPHIPFSGAKQSGIGVAFAGEGLAELTQPQIINAAV